MKRIYLVFVLILLITALLTSCAPSKNNGKSGADVSSITDHPAATQKPPSPEDSSLADDIDNSSSKTTSASDDLSIEKSVTGILDDIAVGNIYILLDDGMTLVFNYSEADISKFTNSLPGSRITVFYTGRIDGSDTSAANVTRVVSVE